MTDPADRAAERILTKLKDLKILKPPLHYATVTVRIILVADIIREEYERAEEV